VAASEVATAIGERHDLNLEQLIVLAEFDTDTEAVKALTVSAVKDPSRFDHLVAQFRRERDDRVAHDAEAVKITEAGVLLVELENGWWLPDGAAYLDELQHRMVPGRSLRPSTGLVLVTRRRPRG